MSGLSVISDERLRSDVEKWQKAFERSYVFKESYKLGEQNQQILCYEAIHAAAQLMMQGATGMQLATQVGAGGVVELVVRVTHKEAAIAAI